MQVEDDWVKRPVIYLSMSLGGSSAQELREYLHNVLSSYEKIYGKNLVINFVVSKKKCNFAKKCEQYEISYRNTDF